MTVSFASRHWSSVTSMMDVIDLPAFLLQVNGARDFTFRALNAAHQTQVGLDTSMMVGKSPEALLPARLAETVTESYEECRATAQPFTYEEHLQLPAGARWWKTTLPPILDATGQVTMILGIAVDISDVKNHGFHLAEKLSKTVQQNRRMLGALSRNMDDMRGPFKSVLGMFSVLREGFVDFGEARKSRSTCARGLRARPCCKRMRYANPQTV